MKKINIFLFFLAGFVLFLLALSLKDELPIPNFGQKSPDQSGNLLKIQSMKIPILLYHYVEYVKDPNDKIRKSLNITPNIFDAQIKTLVSSGFSFITPSQVPDILAGKQPLPKKPIILSFDDGYQDFYTDVFPILKKYNVRAIAYVVPGFINKPNNLTYSQLTEISNSGLVEIGGHTMDHIDLEGIAENRAIFEIDQGKKVLENMVKQKIISFAYPYGVFDSQAIKIVEDSGYETAVTTTFGVTISANNLYQVPRVRPGSLTGKALLNYLDNLTSK